MGIPTPLEVYVAIPISFGSECGTPPYLCIYTYMYLYVYISSICIYGTISFTLIGNVAGVKLVGAGGKRLKHARPGCRLEKNINLTRNTDVEKHH